MLLVWYTLTLANSRVYIHLNLQSLCVNRLQDSIVYLKTFHNFHQHQHLVVLLIIIIMTLIGFKGFWYWCFLGFHRAKVT